MVSFLTDCKHNITVIENSLWRLSERKGSKLKSIFVKYVKFAKLKRTSYEDKNIVYIGINNFNEFESWGK